MQTSRPISKSYFEGEWRADYNVPVAMLAGMYAGPDEEAVAWNPAQTSDMIFTQPVVHELPRIAAPTPLIIGETDRTAPGADRASPEIQARLGQYPALSRRAAKAIPTRPWVTFADLGHAPQTEDPQRFHNPLIDVLSSRGSP